MRLKVESIGPHASATAAALSLLIAGMVQVLERIQNLIDGAGRSLAGRIAAMLIMSAACGVLLLLLLLRDWGQIAVAVMVLLAVVLAQWLLLRQVVIAPVCMLQRLARKNAVHDAEADARLAARGDEIGSLRLTMLATDQEVERQQQAMQALTAKMDEDRRHDPLTRLHNRRHLHLEGPGQFAMAQRLNYPVSVMMIDLDLFKKINDTYGHAAGDAVLVAVAQALGRHRRMYDILIRFGGEEFTLVLLNCNHAQSAQLGERIRADIAALQVQHEQQRIAVSCSIGVSSAIGMDMDAMVQLADEAVYQAKSDGRNCVRHANVSRCGGVQGSAAVTLSRMAQPTVQQGGSMIQ